MRQISRQCLAAFCIAVLLSSCVVQPSLPVSVDSPIKSENDHREYRYLQLDNQLRVLLVSDPKTERAAAALDVNIGSRQDPQDAQGLAHFLEHMLFLGTEKYPQAGEYQAFISAHGGSHNAYTAFEHTNYFFDIDPGYLEPALDRFAQFFVAPLFTEDYVEREKNAVHSEYTANIKDEQRRGADVFKSIINQQHPFAKLSVGNLQTLASDNTAGAAGTLRDQLISFYGQNYSANLMTLVVVGSDSLQALEVLVRAKFSAIKNTRKRIDDIKEPLFTEHALPAKVTIKPGKTLRTLSIAFPTDDERPFYRQKPLHFLGNILGHEGPGSLLSYLKKQGWSEGLSAGPGLSYQGGATFNISIHLTEAGVVHSDQIVEAVFQTINAIRQTKQRRWLFDEQQVLAEQQFRFQQKAAPINVASSLAAGMHYYAAEEVLSGPYLITDFDARRLNHFLSFLRPDNSLITLTAPGVETDQTSQFYHVDYRAAAIANSQLARWQQLGNNPDIHLPEPNPFIAKDLSIVQDEEANDTNPPQLVMDQPGLQLWFKSVDQFKSPRGSLFFSVYSPIASDSAEHKATMRLLIALLSDELNELSYAATLAGLNYSIHPHMRGFSVKIQGFSDRQDLLLKKILAVLQAPALSEERFQNIKREQLRKLNNANKKQPYQLIMGELSDLLYRHSWNDQQLLAAYQAISLPQVKAYQQQLLAAGQIRALVYGNYQQQQAEGFTRQIAAALLTNPMPVPAIEVARLSDSPLSRLQESHYEDASLLLYIQARDLDINRRAAMGVSAQVMRSDFYTSLRTEQQLGYIVSSGAYPVMEVPGLFFLVQSPVAGPEQLKQQIEQYLSRQAEHLATLSEAEFNRHRAALLLRLSEAPQNLQQQAERYWQDLGQGYEQFDFRQQLITAMQGLSLQQWREYFVADVVENNRRIAIYTRGKFAAADLLAASAINDVEKFKSQQQFYTFSTQKPQNSMQ